MVGQGEFIHAGPVVSPESIPRRKGVVHRSPNPSIDRSKPFTSRFTEAGPNHTVSSVIKGNVVPVIKSRPD